jgi:hypothetical protein
MKGLSARPTCSWDILFALREILTQGLYNDGEELKRNEEHFWSRTYSTAESDVWLELFYWRSDLAPLVGAGGI